MDVCTLDGVYLGTVRRIIFGPAPLAVRRERNELGSEFSGELLGPQPTAPLGNPGPSTQSAVNSYGATPDGALALGQGVLMVGRWPLPLGWRSIPLSDILVVSFERVILRRTAHELGVRR